MDGSRPGIALLGGVKCHFHFHLNGAIPGIELPAAHGIFRGGLQDAVSTDRLGIKDLPLGVNGHFHLDGAGDFHAFGQHWIRGGYPHLNSALFGGFGWNRQRNQHCQHGRLHQPNQNTPCTNVGRTRVDEFHNFSVDIESILSIGLCGKIFENLK